MVSPFNLAVIYGRSASTFSCTCSLRRSLASSQSLFHDPQNTYAPCTSKDAPHERCVAKRAERSPGCKLGRSYTSLCPTSCHGHTFCLTSGTRIRRTQTPDQAERVIGKAAPVLSLQDGSFTGSACTGHHLPDHDTFFVAPTPQCRLPGLCFRTIWAAWSRCWTSANFSYNLEE